MKRLDHVLQQDDWKKDLIRWCVHRQIGGMQGRPNKVEDTCYSYWIGGTLRLLGTSQFDLLDHVPLRNFVFSCQSAMGGFSKAQNAYPDLLHSFYSMSYLNLSSSLLLLSSKDTTDNNNNLTEQEVLAEEEDGVILKEMNCTLGIGMETAAKFGALMDHLP